MFFLRRCGWGGGCKMPRHYRLTGHDLYYSEAMDILNKRYANGEIDSEKYKRKKEEILGR